MAKIVLTGGGTYGHVSPLQPIIEELRLANGGSKTLFIGMRGDRFSKLLEAPSQVDEVRFITSGKYRRYPDEPFLKRALDIKSHLLNLQDLFKISWGTISAYRILRKFKPDVVFGNGGYVSVPVGWAANFLNIPIVIHESDSKPGIANRLLAKHADVICLGMPLTKKAGKFADPDKTVFTGIPTRQSFKRSSSIDVKQHRMSLGLKLDKLTLTISGGSQGAEAINQAILQSLPDLLQDMQIVHITGDKNIDQVKQSAENSGTDLADYHVVGFTDKIDQYFAGSDLVVTRASATTFSELAILGKATILIPASHLSDQIENAEVAQAQSAAIIASEGDQQLVHVIKELINDTTRLEELASGISKLAKPESAKQISSILLKKALHE